MSQATPCIDISPRSCIEIPHTQGSATSPTQEKHGVIKFHHSEVSLEMENLSKFCDMYGTTPYSTCFAAWLIVLYHMTGKENICLDVENRSNWDFFGRGECLTTNFTVESVTTPVELLSSIRTSLASTSLERMDEEKHLSGSGNMHMFKIFDDEDSLLQALEQFDHLDRGYVSQAYFYMKSETASLRLLWQDGLQDLGEISGIFAHFYASMLADPGSSIHSVGCPASKQLELCQAEFQTTHDLSIIGLFDQSSSEYPHRRAIHAWDGDLSYSEFKATSNRWAEALASLGLVEGAPILHMFQHSRSAIIAWLSILKAGHPCVPVDVSIPAERLKTIIDITACTGAICDDTGYKQLDGTGLQVLTPSKLGRIDDKTNIETRKNPISRIAAIMFTSGSSGKPKGVFQTQKAIASSLVRVARALELNEETKFLQFAPHCFDASISEIFCPLVTGGCLSIPAPDEKLANIAQNINEMGVTHALLTPTVAEMLSPDQVPGLKSLSLGGELCSSHLRKVWCPHLQLNILYGTTEGAVWDTIHHVQTNDKQDFPSIGFPIGGRVWVVHPNDWTILSPIGVPGEICIQGPEIAEGYVGEPQRTEEVFIQRAPWFDLKDNSTSDHQRIYRTGDMGRVLEDGSLHILGRIDRQIKINGQRMEPGEVEGVLKQYLPAQFGIFVDSLDPGNGRSKLAVFVSYGENSEPTIIPETEHDPVVREAIQSSRDTLSEAMVPSMVFHITTFPMTTNNKIDQQGLRKLGLDNFKSQALPRSISNDGSETSTRGTNESNKVVDVISTFLGRQKQNGVEDLSDQSSTLKDLGVDSLDAVSLASTLKEDAKVEVPASQLLNPQVCVSDLAGMTQQTKPKESPKAFLERELDEWMSKLDGPNSQEPSSVLLTGANGFLGKEILRKILQCPLQPTVTCVVRGNDYPHARQKLLDVFRELSWWSHSLEARVKVWVGDLSQPKVGLDQPQWEKVFGLNGKPRQFDFIIHNGALVNWLEPFESLRKTNVSSTYEFLNGFLQSHDPPTFFYISGGYLSGATETHQELVGKLSQLPAYDQTKFVSEVMIEHVQSMNSSTEGRLRIFKPGYITGSTEDGHAQTSDTLWRLVKACIQTGSYSQGDADGWVTVAGVDSIASILADQVSSLTAFSREGITKKVLDGVYFQDIWDHLDDMGIHLTPMKHDDWAKSMQQSLERDGQVHPLFPLKDWFEGCDGKIGIDRPADHLISGEVCHRAKLAVRRSLEYLVSSGFLSRSGTGI